MTKERLTKKLEDLNRLINGINSDVVKLINVSAETDLLTRRKNVPEEKLIIAENKIEEILKKYNSREN
ncbi:MAG: hypothetical protein KDC73_06585 [Ignavibacteriae bacterium]|nr:hypothetical protein [Ignavibacteriota bacterium]MCB0724353.1 hypothetical protein [Ignavibacteriota bacterium]MCB9243603.1 hypothetical protein [Ignavibacteriales bacterium]